MKKFCAKDMVELLKGAMCEQGFRVEGWKINCLARNRNASKEKSGASGVQQMLQQESADARMKPGLMTECNDDIKVLCANVSQLGKLCQRGLANIPNTGSDEVSD